MLNKDISKLSNQSETLFAQDAMFAQRTMAQEHAILEVFTETSRITRSAFTSIIRISLLISFF
jgi:hypothetical protein